MENKIQTEVVKFVVLIEQLSKTYRYFFNYLTHMHTDSHFRTWKQATFDENVFNDYRNSCQTNRLIYYCNP